MRNRIRIILAVILLCAGAVLIFLSGREYRPFVEEKIRQEAVREAVVQETDDPLERIIDFEALKKINADIVGWLYIPQIGVDCPILKGSTDTQYLTRNFEGNYSPLGSVFTYSHTDEKLSDSHLCLFGHNMRSGQMFGRLPEFTDSQFRTENDRYWLYTPARAKEIAVWSACEAGEDDAVFQDEWKLEEETRQTVTLATCSGYGATSRRIVVNGVVEREKVIL